MPKKLFSKLAALLLFSLLFAACGNEWDKISKKGNKWEYQIVQPGVKIKVVSIVKENYKIGDKKYAEIVLDENTSKDTTEIYAWNEKQKALTYAGRSSHDKGNKQPRFFIKEKILGQLEGKTGTTMSAEDGSKIKYIGKEKIKVPAGEFEALKFTQTKNGATETFWYAPSKGFVKVIRAGKTFSLVKFTEGSGGDPKKPGSKEGFELIKTFYATAQKGDAQKTMALFSKNGQTAIKADLPALKKLVDDIKSKSKAIRTAIFIDKPMNYGLSFRYFDDSNGENNVYFSRTAIVLEKEGGKLKIKSLKTITTKLLK